MNIGIIGCGWLGKKIADNCKKKHNIFATTTATAKKKQFESESITTFVINFDEFDNKKWDILEKLDVIIITISFSKQLTFENLDKRLQNISNFIKNYKKQLFFTSSTGIYLAKNGECVENCPENMLDERLHTIEKYFQNNFPQINILRLGGLMGENRKLCNYKISEPESVVNHIHFQDVIGVINQMISQNIHAKTYNLVAPKHPTKQMVIDFQLNNELTDNQHFRYGKIVSCEKIEKELSYRFLFPNPIFF